MPLREQSEFTEIQPNLMNLLNSIRLNGHWLSSINSSLHRSPDPILKGETIHHLQTALVDQFDTVFQQRGILVPENWSTYPISFKIW